jgi:hypothetical protein
MAMLNATFQFTCTVTTQRTIDSHPERCYQSGPSVVFNATAMPAKISVKKQVATSIQRVNEKYNN